ncbi:MAG: nucleotidyltransferase family protein [Alphaproteobacteria bacterium]
MISQAIILAAGLGTRMQPLTKEIPKPLLQFKGREIIDWSIEKLIQFDVKKIVINGYYLKEKIQSFIEKKRRQYPSVEFIFSNEDEILGTGGGVENALKYLDENPFFIVNGDSYWESNNSVFKQLNLAWKKHQKTTLLLCDFKNINCSVKSGDYKLNKNKTISRLSDNNNKQYIGLGVMKESLFHFKDHKKKFFSLTDLWDKAEKKNTLFGEEFDGKWFHFSKPEDLLPVKNNLFNCRGGLGK